MFISTRPHVRAKQIKEMKAMRRHETLSQAFYIAKTVSGVALAIIVLWAMVWLMYFAVS